MPNKIRVISLTNTVGFAGGEARILSFAKTIDRDRFQHRVVCVKRLDPDSAPEDAAMRRQFESAGIPVSDLNQGYRSGGILKALNPIMVLASSVKRLADFIRLTGIQAIDAHQPPASLVAVLSAKLTGIKALVTGYEAAIWNGTMGLESKLSSAPEVAGSQVSYSLADVVITDSDARRDEIRASLIRKPRRMAVIPNGVEPPLSTHSPNEMRRLLGIPLDPNVRVIGQIGRLVPYKGYLQLLDAAKLVIKEDKNVFFLIIGHVRQPDYKKCLEQRILDLGLSDHVRIAGYPGPVADVWKVIDIHVHASLYDSLPNSIIEGMSLAKPLATTSVGGIPSMVDQGVTGLIVPPDDSEALASALLKLLGNSTLATKLGIAAQRRYQERYTSEVMTRQLEKLLIDVCS
jgi:glycosyltransferase involved in cell wall biosynthesis